MVNKQISCQSHQNARSRQGELKRRHNWQKTMHEQGMRVHASLVGEGGRTGCTPRVAKCSSFFACFEEKDWAA